MRDDMTDGLTETVDRRSVLQFIGVGSLATVGLTSSGTAQSDEPDLTWYDGGGAVGGLPLEEVTFNSGYGLRLLGSAEATPEGNLEIEYTNEDTNRSLTVTLEPNQSVLLEDRLDHTTGNVYDRQGEIEDVPGVEIAQNDEQFEIPVSVSGDMDTFSEEPYASYSATLYDGGEVVASTESANFLVGYRPQPTAELDEGTLTVRFQPGGILDRADIRLGVSDESISSRIDPVESDEVRDTATATYSEADDRYTFVIEGVDYDVGPWGIQVTEDGDDRMLFMSPSPDLEVGGESDDTPVVEEDAVELDGSTITISADNTASLGIEVPDGWEVDDPSDDGSVQPGGAIWNFGVLGDYEVTLTLIPPEDAEEGDTVDLDIAGAESTVATLDVVEEIGGRPPVEDDVFEAVSGGNDELSPIDLSNSINDAAEDGKVGDVDVGPLDFVDIINWNAGRV